MNRQEEVQAATRALVNAHRAHSQFSVPEGQALASLDTVYEIQRAVAEELWSANGDSILAWKVGSPSPQATPTAAPIPGSKRYQSPVELKAADFHVIGIEAELAYRLHGDLPPRATPYDEAELSAAVASIHVAIEVCDSRIRNWCEADPSWKLADNQMNAALVIGDGIDDWRSIIPEQQPATLYVDRAIRADVVGAHPYGNPLRLLPWLANHCARHGAGLRAGDVVTTGSWTGMIFVEPGAEVIARFPGIGEAHVIFRR